jgi:hypothetical protein
MVCLTVYNECSGLLCAGITWTGLQQGDQALNTACCLQHLLLLQGLYHLHGMPDTTLCCSDAFGWSATKVSKKSTVTLTLPAIARLRYRIMPTSQTYTLQCTLRTVKASHAWRCGILARQSFLQCGSQQPVNSTCAQWLASLSPTAQALRCMGTVAQGKLKWCRKHLGKSNGRAPLSLSVCDRPQAC